MNNPGLVFTIASFLLVIGPLIFIHELGHYFAGRWFGVKAEAFSIGFGREMFGWTDRRGTRWKVGWLPLGGYVRFKGDMNPASTPSDEWLALPAAERAETFQSKKVWQRFIIVFAGPLTNFLFAVVALMIVFATMGYPSSAAIVSDVQPGSPAAAAGFTSGDEVLEVNGNRIDTFADLVSYVSLRPDQPMRFVVERAGQRVEVNAVSRAEVRRDEFGNEARIGVIGLRTSSFEYTTLPLHQLPGAAIKATADTVETMVVALGQVVTGQRSVKELGGPLKIAEVSGQQASLGWINFFWLMIVVSINLGFINLLPIPLLDGGHLLFYAIEGVRRKPLNAEAQEWAFRTGLAVLLALMIFVTFNDLASFGLFTRLGGLIG
ncbi:RIP metalloprotease RseP [Sphingosinicella terrae]|uniref:RIP metalloprotease RseP n=1 Tax=Sphingosinicella terrae TaxID=2172047 RepID=UPI000E0DE534|nr:RIP metalloprotease RseP [Sphingosinicella terrae]